MSEDIQTEIKAGIYSITLNRPEKGNALTDAHAVLLGDLLESAPADTRAIVLRGVGDDFCVGREIQRRPPGSAPLEALAMRRTQDVVFRAYSAFRRAPAPVISVVRGRAHGFGCALAAVSDITLASSSAQFQVPEFAHGIMPTMVMSSLIDRVALKALMYLVYSAEPIDAGRALALGIASAVWPDNELDGAVDRLLDRLTHSPLPAVLAVKEFARDAQPIDLNKATQYARALHSVVNSSSEMRRPTPDKAGH